MQIKKPLIYVIIALMPTQLSLTIWPQLNSVNGIRIDYLAYTLYFTDILLALLLILNIINKKINIKKLKDYTVITKTIIGIIIIWFIYHITNNPNHTYHLYIAAKALLYINTYLTLKTAKFNHKIINNIFTIQVIGLTILSTAQLINQGSINGPLYLLGERRLTAQTPGIATQFFHGQEILRPYGLFSHPNTLSGYIMLVLIWQITTFHVGNLKKLLKTHPLVIISLISGVNLLIITSSQAAMLTGIILIIYHLLVYRRITSKRTLPNINHLLICALITPFILEYATVLTHESIQIRNIIFNNHLKALKANLITGMGWHGFLLKLKTISTTLNTKTIQPVHSGLWFLIGSLGIPLTGIVYAKLYKPLTNIKITPPAYPLTAILILSALDHYWITQPQTILLAILVIALYKSNPHDPSQSQTTAPTQTKHRHHLSTSR